MHHNPEHFLAGDALGGRLLAHARLLLKLARRFAAIAPAGLGQAARVVNYKSGKVVIHAENGAVAAKLRQMSRRLSDDLSKGGVECSDMEIKVQPRRNLREVAPTTLKPLSARTFATLESTAKNLPDGPLRHALDTLLQRAVKKG